MIPQGFPDSKSASTKPAVSVRQVTKIFSIPFRNRPVVAVRDLNLQVKPGEIYGLLGPNGSGKSTTLKIILGLVPPTHGRVEIFGRPSSHVGSRETVGFLPESPYFYKHLTGRETLRFYGRLCGLRGAQLQVRVDELLALVELTAAADRRLHGYSKGMLQRIGLAQALVHQPQLLVLDEPTASLDPAGARAMRDLIVDCKRRGIAVLLSSHLLGPMQEICDRVGILAHGSLVREGALAELLGVETRFDLILENAPAAALTELESLAIRTGIQLVRRRRCQISLEDYFLEVTEAASRQSHHRNETLPPPRIFR